MQLVVCVELRERTQRDKFGGGENERASATCMR